MTYFLQQGPASRSFIRLPIVPLNGDTDSNVQASVRHSRSKLAHCYENPGMVAPWKRQRGSKVRASALLVTLLYTPLCSAVGNPLTLILLGFCALTLVTDDQLFLQFHWVPKRRVGRWKSSNPFVVGLVPPKPGFLWRVSRSPHPPTHHLIGIQKDIAFKRLKKFWEPCSKKQKKQQDTFFFIVTLHFLQCISCKQPVCK